MNIKCNELIKFLINKSLHLSQNDAICIDLREIKDILFCSNESIYDSVSQIRQEKFYYPVHFGNKLIISERNIFEYVDIYDKDFLSYRISTDFESLSKGVTNMPQQSDTCSANENNYHKTERKKQYQFIIKPSNRDKLEKLVKENNYKSASSFLDSLIESM